MENEKIYNRSVPAVKKIFLQRNDKDSRPKLYVWQTWKVQRLESLLAEARRILGLENNEGTRIFTHSGDLVTSEDQIVDGQIYVVAGDEDFYKRRQKRLENKDAIYNRPDQTHPDAYIIYVFLNGNGLESQCVHFQRMQLERGMGFVMELIARRYGVKPYKLCKMDGHRVKDVTELMSRGAYVLVPVSQSFRDAWYFLPDNAIDTSVDVDTIKQRDAQREKLILRHDQRLAARRKPSMPDVSALNMALSR
ncbi:unnamed protein product [Enterobius vermicularis]|uniref:Doublecortin domain-containing protein n=1 Tax=Enterobius vermicularis TaxID=51028 RepID=A0A3P6HBX2_ENTVE|nr:unnamed protein product [Enterobius vermicularis]